METPNLLSRRGREPLFNLVAAGDAAGVHYFAVDDDAGRAHDAIAHDVAQLFHLLQLDGYAFRLGHLLDEGDGVFAVGATGAEYFDVHG